MKNKQLVIGSIVGLAVVIVGAVCICTAPKNSTDTEGESYIQIDNQESSGEGAGLQMQNPGSISAQEESGADNENASQNEIVGDTGIVSQGGTSGGTSTVIYIESVDNQGEMGEIEIYEEPSGEYDPSNSSTTNSGQAIVEEQYTPPDMTQEYLNIRQDIFERPDIDTSPETITPGDGEVN